MIGLIRVLSIELLSQYGRKLHDPKPAKMES